MWRIPRVWIWIRWVGFLLPRPTDFGSAFPTFGGLEMIREDFQARTIEDRLAMYDKHADKRDRAWYTLQTPDRLIRLEDRDGNGVADHRTLFSDAFKRPSAGLGFSILAERNSAACIPALRRLTDPNDDGVADTNEKIVNGFGVRVSFIGHDLHGITRGPDGRLYFSVGDRGFRRGRGWQDPRGIRPRCGFPL